MQAEKRLSPNKDIRAGCIKPSGECKLPCVIQGFGWSEMEVRICSSHAPSWPAPLVVKGLINELHPADD